MRGRPRSAATPATAAENGSPPLTRSATRLTASSMPIGDAAAPATTTVISPRTPVAAHSASSSQRAAPGLLPGLGEFPADRGAALVAERRAGVGEEVGQPVRSLEEHHRARFPGQLGQPPSPLTGLAWQESLEAEPVRGQPGQGQRDQHRGRAGDDADGNAGGDRGRHQAVARVGDRRHPRVADHDHRPPGQQVHQQRLGAGRLVAVEVGEHPGRALDAEPGQQGAQPPGVLGGDDVGLGQRPAQRRGRVVEVADRGSGQHQPSPVTRIARSHPCSIPDSRPVGVRRAT